MSLKVHVWVARQQACENSNISVSETTFFKSHWNVIVQVGAIKMVKLKKNNSTNY